VHALALLREVPPPAADGRSRARRTANEILAEVAARLGNTVAVCKKAYVHPGLLELACAGMPDEIVALRAATPRRRAGLSAGEVQLLAFLRRTAQNG
jgi:DNA topoisomerase-1